MARLKDEEAWCEPQEELTAQKFEDEVYRLTTRMFECFDYIKDRLNMLDEKVYEIDDIIGKFNMFTEKVAAVDCIMEKFNMLTDKVDAVDDQLQELKEERVKFGSLQEIEE